MGTGKPVGRPRKNPPPVEDAFDDFQSPEAGVIDDFFDEIAPTASYVEIFRLKEDGRKPQLGRFSLDLMRENVYGFLREKFKSGRYQLVGKDNSSKYVRSITLEVEAEDPRSGSASQSSGGDFNQQLILALIANQKPAPALDVGSLLQGLAAMRPAVPDMAAMITAIGTLTGKGGSVKEALEIISAAKDLVPEGKGSEKEDNLYTVIKDVGNKAVEAFSGRPMLPARVEIVKPAGEPKDNPPAELPLSSPEAQEQMLQQWLTTQLTFLKQKAAQGKDPEVWSDYVIDNDEEPGCNAILTAIERGATFDHLLAFDKAIAEDPKLRDWFKKFYDSLLLSMQPPMDTPRPSGDADHTATDGAASSGENPSGEPASEPPPKSGRR